MPSPFGHSLAGYFVSVCSSKSLRVHKVKNQLFCISIASVPDLDFLPGILMGTPNLFHHGISHSLGAGILFSCILALILNKKSSNFKKEFFTCFGLYGSHVFLDYLSVDGRPPLGIPIFWPLSNEYFIFPYSPFPQIKRSELDYATMAEFLNDACSIHNLYVIILELTIFIPIIIFCLYFKRSNKTPGNHTVGSR
jgi:inner membrane protein